MSAGHSPNVRLTVLERDDWTCRACGFRQSPEEHRLAVEALMRSDVRIERWLTIDHIVPRSKKGSNRLENLQVLCNRCNHDKGDALDPADVTPQRIRKHPGRSKLIGSFHRPKKKANLMLVHDQRCDEQFCMNTCPVYLERGVYL